MAHSEHTWKRLGDGSLITEDAEVGLGHIVPIEVYTLVYVSLLIMTGITVWVAQYDFGGSGMLNLIIAMAIATVKAGVVTLFFMHLTWESKITWGIVIYPLFIFGLILGSILSDMIVKEQPQPSFPHSAAEVLKSKAAGALQLQLRREAGDYPPPDLHGEKTPPHGPPPAHH